MDPGAFPGEIVVIDRQGLAFFRALEYLRRQKVIESDPAEMLKPPKPEKKAPQSSIQEWAAIGVQEDWVYVLRKAGFYLIQDIRDEKAQGLQQKIGEIVKKFRLDLQKPSVDEVQGWIDKATE